MTLQLYRLSSYPGPVAYDPAKGEIFVSLPVGETLISGYSVISDSNNTVTKTITTSHPGNFAYNSAKGEMYTETANNTISVITDSGTTVIANLSLPSHEYIGPMAYDTSEGKLFIINTIFQWAFSQHRFRDYTSELSRVMAVTIGNLIITKEDKVTLLPLCNL